MADELAWSICVRQAQADRAYTIGAMVEVVIVLGSSFVNPIDVYRRKSVLFVHRQVERTAVYLARRGKDNLHLRIEIAARLEESQLRSAVQFQIAPRVD